MALTSWRSPSAFADLGGGTARPNTDLTNPQNVYGTDDVYAVCNISGGKTGASNSICFSGFGFTASDIPATARILGVHCRTEAKCTPSSSMFSAHKITRNAPTGTDNSSAQGITGHTTTEGIVTATTSTIPAGLTQAECVSTALGVVISYNNWTATNGSISVDQLQVQVEFDTHFIDLAAGDFTTGGQGMALSLIRRLTATLQAFTTAGQTADLLAGRRVDAEAATFTTAGAAAQLKASRILQGGAATFTTAGRSADLLRRFKIQADRGDFTLSGQVAGLFAARLLAADPTAFITTGQVVGLQYIAGLTLTAGSGTFSTAGQTADLLAGRLLDAAAAAFTSTGFPADIAKRFSLQAGAGQFDLVGQDLGFSFFRVLHTEAGTFVLTGNPASFQVIQVVDDDTLALVYEFCASLSKHEQTEGLAFIEQSGGGKTCRD